MPCSATVKHRFNFLVTSILNIRYKEMWKKIFNYFFLKMDNPSFQTSFKLEKIFPVFFNGINYSGNKSDFLILILSACGIHPICLYLSHHKSVKRQIQYFIAFVFLFAEIRHFRRHSLKEKKKNWHPCMWLLLYNAPHVKMF